ncbi:MAG: trypsin-like peptidase domain-containing protein [Mesorhizobium sp.]|nr:MAG: trypsin-like peptidase domain-containing protein [Mesorhizobium sp.]
MAGYGPRSFIFDQLHRATVKIVVSSPERQGTGFCVAPGFILTNAHVVFGDGDYAPSAVKIRIYADKPPFEERTVLDIERAAGADLALLRADTSKLRCVIVDKSVASGDPLYAWSVVPGAEMKAESITVIVEGWRHSPEGGHGTSFLKFKEGQVHPGSSGSALLNKVSLAVCAVLKSTRDPSGAAGGFGVGIEALASEFPRFGSLLQLNSHNLRWKAIVWLRKAVSSLLRPSMWIRAAYTACIAFTSVQILASAVASLSAARLLFPNDGVFAEQPVFTVMSYDPQQHLETSLDSMPSWFLERFGGLEAFKDAMRLATFVVPLSRGTKGVEISGRPLNIGLGGASSISGPQIQIDEREIRYAGHAAPQNDCLDLPANNALHPNNFSPPMSALGVLEASSACHLFFTSRKQRFTLTDVVEYSQNEIRWKYTTFFVKEYVFYIARTASGNVYSNMNDYVDNWMSDSVYPGLGIEKDCLAHNTCVARDVKLATFYPSGKHLRARIPPGSIIVDPRLISDEASYLHIELKVGPALSSFELIVNLRPETVRMQQMLAPETFKDLLPYNGTVGEIDVLRDQGQSKWEFASKLVSRNIGKLNFELFSVHVHVMILLVAGLFAAILDALWLKLSRRERRSETQILDKL